MLKYISKLIFAIRHRIIFPSGFIYDFMDKMKYLFFKHTPSLINQIPIGDKRNLHIANFNNYNGGDLLLTIVIRDLFDKQLHRFNWEKLHVHKKFNPKYIQNHTMLLIGGGGLIINDTNRRSSTGWQWDCKDEYMDLIDIPIVVFAVGYNNFRGKDKFKNQFKKNINKLISKSTFFGVRNKGSIKSIKNFTDKSFHSKISYQPCMTTIIDKLYVDLFQNINKQNSIGINIAFDREEIRYGENKERIFKQICKSLIYLSKNFLIHYIAHDPNDEKFIKYLNAYNVEYELIRLYSCKPEKIINYYKNQKIIIGTRGHSQMIPFGCNTMILSLISHNKLYWFLEDNNLLDLGIEIFEKNLDIEIIDKIENINENYSDYMNRINKAKNKIYDITSKNLELIAKQL